MKVVLLSLLALINASLLLGYDFNTSFRFLQPLGDYHLVGLLRVDDDVVAIIERDKDHARFRVSVDDELDGYKVVRLALNGRESYVELERAGNAYQVGIKQAKSPFRDPAHEIAMDVGYVDDEGKLTPLGQSQIVKNLANLNQVAEDFMMMSGRRRVSFQELEASYLAIKKHMDAGVSFAMHGGREHTTLTTTFHQLKPLVGENYSELVFNKGFAKLQVTTRYGEVVTYELITH